MKKYIYGNWKMNKDINETIAYANEFNNLIKSVASNVCVGIAIPYINLAKACETFNLANITILAENISEHESGAYTSQISIPMIKSLGVKQTLIGHSEVRQYLSESDELLNKKIHACLNNNVVPVICIGETLQQFENGTTEQVVIKQLDTCLANIKHEQCANIIIAYEPVWAIGTGKTATSEIIKKVHLIIRNHLIKLFGQSAMGIPLLYGGSVTVTTASDILRIENVNGLLIGGASLKPDVFNQIIKIASC